MWAQKTSPFIQTTQCSNYQSAKLTVMSLHFPFPIGLHLQFDIISYLDTFHISNRNVPPSEPRLSFGYIDISLFCTRFISSGDRFLAWSRHLWTLPSRCRTFVGWGMLYTHIYMYICNCWVGNCFCICKMRPVFVCLYFSWYQLALILMHRDFSWHWLCILGESVCANLTSQHCHVACHHAGMWQ